MKRNLVLAFILLIVAVWLAACSTPRPSTTESQQKENVSGQARHPLDTGQQSQPVSGNETAKKPQPANVDAASTEKDESRLQSAALGSQAGKPKSKVERKRDARVMAGPAGRESLVAEASAAPGLMLNKQASVAARAKPAMKMQSPAMTVPSGIVANVPPQLRYPSETLDRKNYAHFDDNPVLRVAETPVSTFSIDVDTGSYSNARRILHEGRLPAKDVVRAEEFINYFNYNYPAPESSKQPFNVITEIGPTPWNTGTHLLHIGIKGYEIPATSLPPSNLVFLVDVSGSMRSANKLALLKKSLQLLTRKLRAQDTISLVVYAGASGVVLEPTQGSDKATILSALESLSAGGSTNGAAGIRLAYLKAQQAFIGNGINRVILATDGDFNVGTVNFEALKNLVEEKRKTGIFLTTLGFGTGNYNDKLMEQLADAGNGNYAYIDTLMEAQKVLVNEMGSTLNTIAKDVKIQIEFNPQLVAEYRLIGYENRALRREDFNNDKIDAGEIGAGHTVTAIYEISLVGEEGQYIDPLRYQSRSAQTERVKSTAKELAFLRLRYKKPDSNTSILTETPIMKSRIITAFNNTSKRYQFAASVAGFAQLLRGGRFTEHYSFTDVVSTALKARESDRYGYRGEFIRLVELADTLSGSARAPARDKAFN